MNKNSKKKLIQDIPKGKIFIQASFNNTIISITDQSGAVLGWATSGSAGFKGTKKSTPFAAQTAMKNVLDKVSVYNIKSVDIFVSGVGSGRDAAFRALSASTIDINSIKDVTPIAHNGIRPKKPRRV